MHSAFSKKILLTIVLFSCLLPGWVLSQTWIYEATSINNQSIVVGKATAPSFSGAVVFVGGSVTYQKSGADFKDINSADLPAIVGGSYMDNFFKIQLKVGTWKEKVFPFPEAGGNLKGVANSINDSYEAVGTFYGDESSALYELFRNAAPVDLEEKVVGWGEISAIDINNDGIILANARKVETKDGKSTLSGSSKSVLLIPVDLAVDANRDGTIKFAGNFSDPGAAGKSQDTTSESRPFRFWWNDDDDSNEEDHPDSSTKDSANSEIGSIRDLEDFTRLHMYIGGLHDAVANGTFQVGFEWRTTTGTPSIKVYRAAEPTGGIKYLTNENAGYFSAMQQAAPFKNALGTVNSSGGFKLPAEFWQSTPSGIPAFDAEHPSRYLVFEGTGEGKGQLVMTFWKGTEKIGEGGSCWIEIKNIKKMYQRQDSATGHPWENVQFEPEADEPKEDVIVFVHGWRMSPKGAGNFAESMYKRLWHRGFKGRFAAFHWDTWWFNNWQWVDDVGGGPIAAALSHYNDSEHTAWQSAAALKAFVNGLPFKNKNLTAHSMGNIVAGEALQLGMQVKNYAMLQAAVPAACYDEATSVKQTTQYQHVGITMWDADSPDDDPDPPTRALAYRGRFKNINQNVSNNITNFYLPQDYATFMPWEVNNDQTKPPTDYPNGQLVTNFRYIRSGPSAQKLYKHQGLILDHYLSDPYEAMPYACRTWGKSAGAYGATAGAVGASVNLSSGTFQLPGESSGFGDEHSGEFNANIQYLKPFYDAFMDKLQVPRNQ